MVISIKDLKNIRKKYMDKKIVVCKGSFDMFHVGHLNFLENAKKFGDILVTIVKCDKVISKQKGHLRPIINESDRAKIVDNIKFNDYTVIANEPTDLKEFDIADVPKEEEEQWSYYAQIFIELKPDILAHVDNNEISSSINKLYDDLNIEIKIINYTKGISTTEIIKRMENI